MDRVIIILTHRQMKALFKKLMDVEDKLERANLAEFMLLLQRPFRLIWLNFIGGLARGFGIAIGLTIVASLFILFLSKVASWNLPVIGRYIAELVRIVNAHLKIYS